MDKHQQNLKPTGADLVLTKDLSYSYLSLKPKDQRESRIYYQSKLKEIADIYLFLIIVAVLAFANFAF